MEVNNSTIDKLVKELKDADEGDIQDKVMEIIRESKAGQTRSTAKYQEEQKRKAKKEINARKMKKDANNMSYKEKLKMKRDHKTIIKGNKCVILFPNGRIKQNTVTESSEVEFLESKIGDNVLSFHCPYVETGDLAGANIKVFYSPTSMMKPNKNARIIFPEELSTVNGVVIIYSDKIEVKVNMIEKLLEDSKKYANI